MFVLSIFIMIVITKPLYLQICDDNLRIMHVNPRFPGSTHDSYIWRQSNVSHAMEELYRRNPNDLYYLIGDSGKILN